LKCWTPSTPCTPCNDNPSIASQVSNPGIKLGLCTPCMTSVSNLSLQRKWEQMLSCLRIPETNLWIFCQRTPCGQFDCTPCGNSYSDKETIETHFHLPFPLRFQTFNQEITHT
jgi:hypothetical protein